MDIDPESSHSKVKYVLNESFPLKDSVSCDETSTHLARDPSTALLSFAVR